MRPRGSLSLRRVAIAQCLLERVVFCDDSGGTIEVRNRFHRIAAYEILQAACHFGQSLIAGGSIYQLMETRIEAGCLRKAIVPQHQHKLRLNII